MLPEVTQSEGSGSQASVGLPDALGPLGPLTTLSLLGSPDGILTGLEPNWERRTNEECAGSSPSTCHSPRPKGRPGKPVTAGSPTSSQGPLCSTTLGPPWGTAELTPARRCPGLVAKGPSPAWPHPPGQTAEQSHRGWGWGLCVWKVVLAFSARSVRFLFLELLEKPIDSASRILTSFLLKQSPDQLSHTLS